MIPIIENRTYSYSGDNVVAISATLNIYNDEGSLVLDSTTLSVVSNIALPDFKDIVYNTLTEQAIAYMTKLLELDRARLNIFPESRDFAHAVDMIFDPIQIAIGG